MACQQFPESDPPANHNGMFNTLEECEQGCSPTCSFPTDYCTGSDPDFDSLASAQLMANYLESLGFSTNILSTPAPADPENEFPGNPDARTLCHWCLVSDCENGPDVFRCGPMCDGTPYDAETEMCCLQCDGMTVAVEQRPMTLREKCGRCPGGLSDADCDAISTIGCRYSVGRDLCGDYVWDEDLQMMVPPLC